MKLIDWLKQNNLTQAGFALLIKSHQKHVNELVNGKIRPTLNTVEAIHAATKGVVSYPDWALPKKAKR